MTGLRCALSGPIRSRDAMTPDGETPDDVLAAELIRVVAGYGRNALTDPVALRLALRARKAAAAALQAGQADLLVAAVTSGAVDRLRAGSSGASGEAVQAALADAVRLLQARAGVPQADARSACAAFGIALGLPDAGQLTGPPGPPPWLGGTAVDPAGVSTEAGESTLDPLLDPLPAKGSRPDVGAPAVRWDDSTEATAAALFEIGRPEESTRPPQTPEAATTSGPSGERGHRRRWVLLAGAAAALAVVLATVVSKGSDPEPPPAPDRYAVDQVGQRFRALGAVEQLRAERCSPLALAPGERESVACSFGGDTLVLVRYDTRGGLLDARRKAITPDKTAVRNDQAVQNGAAYAIQENASGSSTLYWDVETPRPVSARVVTERLSLPELVGFWDARRFTVVTRPLVLGPTFRSGVLYTLAENLVNEPGDCISDPKPFHGAVEQVKCTFSSGVIALFVLLADAPTFNSYLADYASDTASRPGTYHHEVWETTSGDRIGNLVYYADNATGDAALFFDAGPTSLTFAYLTHPTMTPQALKTWWRSAAVN
jgi:hypothetical protein